MPDDARTLRPEARPVPYLRAMAESRPSTPEELLEVPGVGPAKLERYGEESLETLRGG